MTKHCVWAVVPALLAASPLFVSPATASASAPAASARASSWNTSLLGRTTLGEHWSGPNVQRGDLPGKVVLVEFWGHNCPACIASMPHISQLYASYARSGLVVIGAHVGASAKQQAMAVVRRMGVRYTILSGAYVPDVRFSFIPTALVFDAAGRLVYQGSPNANMDQAIYRALAAKAAS